MEIKFLIISKFYMIKVNLAVISLDESLSNDDIENAKQNFLLAMNSFMQISRTMSQSSEQVVVVTGI